MKKKEPIKTLKQFMRLIDRTVRCARDCSSMLDGRLEICPTHWFYLIKGIREFKKEQESCLHANTWFDRTISVDSKGNEEGKKQICRHCGGLVEIRLPVPSSGCDHLYYPDNCVVCQREFPQTDMNYLKQQISEKDLRIKRLEEERVNKYANAERLIEWMDDPKRKPAQLAFTEGMERQIAYRFEALAVN